MGTYSEFLIGQYSFCETKNDVEPLIMTIFRERDKITYAEATEEIDCSETTGDTPADMYHVYQYRTSASIVRKRLDIMGFSLENVQLAFDVGIKERILEIEAYMESANDNYGYLSDLKRDQDTLISSDFSSWIEAFRDILSRNLQTYNYHKRDTMKDENPLIQYILYEDDYDQIYRFPCSDIRALIRIMVEVCSPEELIIQDVSGLIASGYYDPEDAICNLNIQYLTKDYSVNEKIILLAEGSTDISILRESLGILYPELLDYFSFMDFGIANVQGGTSALVATIKAFIGSNISNRIIALFDNDTAGHLAKKQLEGFSIPENIKVMTYPDIEDACNYPTIGPSGVNILNVNGLACSIELYLGSDILSRNGQSIPVQWTGYEKTLRQYQGEILDKRQVQEAFAKKVAECKRTNTIGDSDTWQSMRCLLEAIFAAFK
jgi:hypothetical protein